MRHGDQPSENTVFTAALVDLAVTEAKLAADAVVSSKISDGTILNADINASAAIVPTKLDLSSAWVSAGAVSLDGGFDTGDNVTLKTKTIDIGDWNMDTTASKAVAHGLTVTDIRHISAMIRDDVGTVISPVGLRDSSGTPDSEVQAVDATNITLGRTASAFFDGTDYNSTSYNRGWLTVWYVA